MPVQLTGVLDRIIYHNEENHYTIAEFLPDGARGRVTILGALPGVQCGETLLLSGDWRDSPRHGRQFKFSTFESRLPSSLHGIRKYLGSGLVPGIGKTYADKIVDALGADTFRVLSEESARLRDIPGIGKKRAAAIKSAWDEQRLTRELYIHLQTHGVTPGQCLKLLKAYGAETRQILDNDPYRIARDITGVGFRTADRIAINRGLANDAPARLDAGLLFAMETARDDGHTALSPAALLDTAAGILGVPSHSLAPRLDALVAARRLVAAPGALQLP
ncbi:MAG: ATP-dependent RecD-like DNA helicase, partial [Opitutaceae bacterium]|nr:ATP-dependent RecD-like DNA helicase [Opitutaceae bacterium]